MENQPNTISEGEVHVIDQNQKRIVVSDIDDSVMVSHSTRKIKKLRLMFFKNAVFRSGKSGPGTHQHKLDKIRNLLEVYKKQGFILIGDSGQSDSTIYQQLAGEYPERIEAIYIRKVNPKKDDRSLETMQLPGTGKTQFVEFGDSLSAMEHARKNGYIH